MNAEYLNVSGWLAHDTDGLAEHVLNSVGTTACMYVNNPLPYTKQGSEPPHSDH